MGRDAYQAQQRGDRGAYARYLAGMDASMQQKVALTAAHILSKGKVADMGMGSGSSTHALAALYPGLDVIGVDVSPQMVDLARERHVLPNLSFVLGDVASEVFPAATLHAIVDSSVLHHVTSFSGYDRGAAARALATQVSALAPHGVLVVRDFLDPGDAPCDLELPTDDGDDGDDPRQCSSAALFRRFAREFRSLAPTPGCAFEELPASTGRIRVRLALRAAVEFVLRKDYRRDWESEIKEEYTYATQAEFERTFARLGLRVLASLPVRNPWIVRNRFRGRFALRDLEGRELDDPATNYVIVGERVHPGAGVRISVAGDAPPRGFLRLDRYRDTYDDRVIELVARPHLTVDAVPYFMADDDVFVLARMSYPRPILRASQRPALDGSRSPDYVTEPITVIQDDEPLAQTIEDALGERIGVGSGEITEISAGPRYFPSPGGLREEIRTVFVAIAPIFARTELPSSSGFSTSGRVGAIEARQLLRAAMVGGLADARLEIGTHALLRRLGRDPGPWIGEAIELREAPAPRATASLEELGLRPHRRRFVRLPPRGPASFLDLRCSRFVEFDANDREVARRELEHVAPRTLSDNTIATALLRRVGGRILIGVVDDDRPTAQAIDGHSELLVAPAWRLPNEVIGIREARAWVCARIEAEHGVHLGEVYELGGRWHPSSGTTCELVFPLAVEVRDEVPCDHPLVWLDLDELIGEPDALRDGHLRVLAWRAAHALGRLRR